MNTPPAQPDPLDAAFAALADPTRRAILRRLAEGEATVTELAQPFALSQPAVSRHLRVLQDAGLIETRIAGATRPRRLRAEPLQAVALWLAAVRSLHEPRFDRLDRLLAALSASDPIPKGDAQ